MSELAPEVCREHRAILCDICDEHADDLWVHPRDLEPPEAGGLMGYPLRQKSARGQPRSNTGIERTCKACGASFLGLAPGKTGERGIWTGDWQWFCSVECAEKQEAR